MIRTPLLRLDHGRASIASVARFALCLWIAQSLAACDSGVRVEHRDSASPQGGLPFPPQPVSPPQPAFPPGPVPPRPIHGYFRGGAAIGGSTYYVNAVIAANGDVRIHVAGPFDERTEFWGGGLPPVLADIAESVQFVGNIETIGDQRLGEGVVLGQACAPSDPGRFCDVPAPARISLAWQPPFPGEMLPSAVAGEVRVTTSAGEEIWYLDVSEGRICSGYCPPSTDPAGVYYPTGMYEEELALFAPTGKAVVTVDSIGRLFFQSPESGCIGNGTLRPRPDGSYYVFDAEVLIENCGADYAFLNGEYQGLAIQPDLAINTWDYYAWLLIFLSVPEGMVPRAAITMLGEGAYWSCGWC